MTPVGTVTIDVARLRTDTPGCADVGHLDNAGGHLASAGGGGHDGETPSKKGLVGSYEAADLAAEGWRSVSARTLTEPRVVDVRFADWRDAVPYDASAATDAGSRSRGARSLCPSGSALRRAACVTWGSTPSSRG